MTRHVAFLRAINVGGRVITMDRLRALFTEQGFGGVATFIASGNVIFDAPAGGAAALEGRIERHLAAALGYDVATLVRTAAELAAVAAHQPYGLPDPLDAGHALLVGFLKVAPDDAARARLATVQTATDDLRVHGREVYWRCRTRISDSKVTLAVVERALGGPATFRSATTVRTLQTKVAPAA